MLPLLCVPNFKLVASGNRQQHIGTPALPGAAGSPVTPLPRQGAAQHNPPLPCPALSTAICPSPGDGDIPFLAPGKRRLSGKLEQSSAVTHVPAATGDQENGTSRAGGTGERSRYSGSSGRVPPLLIWGSSRRVPALPLGGSSRPVSPLLLRGSSRRVPALPLRGSSRRVSPVALSGAQI